MEIAFLTPLEARQIIREELQRFAVALPRTETQPEAPERFKIQELADYLQVTKATIHAYKNRGVFPFYQTGRTVYFKKSEVDAALSNKKKSTSK